MTDNDADPVVPPSTQSDPRDARAHTLPQETSDQRTEAQKDRDRIQYASEFRRLGGVTQVASSQERHGFNNRLTHTLAVAQIARRIAEYLARPEVTVPDVLKSAGGLNPDVVEAAALAHDLGHPPFGHVAEVVLDERLVAEQVPDGFEGNPQSFRIVTKLADRHVDWPGLDLTRATLAAILKYPWHRQATEGIRGRKWGAYASEKRDFDFARELAGAGEYKTLEAEIMDWADDIAYSIHDLEDFYRVGLIPLDRLVSRLPRTVDQESETTDDDSHKTPELLPGPDFDEFVSKAIFRIRARDLWKDHYDENLLKARFKRTMDLAALVPSLSSPFHGTSVERAELMVFSSQLIEQYVQDGLTVKSPKDNGGRTVQLNQELEIEITMLKQLTWVYVIENPDLATAQHGQRQIIGDLFDDLSKEATEDDHDPFLFPAVFRDEIVKLREESGTRGDRLRVVADYIASLSEQEAIALHGRLKGYNPGSILDRIG